MKRPALTKAILTLSPSLKRAIWRQWYEFLAGRHPTTAWSFMNCGYEPAAQPGRPILEQADEPDRFSIQLYHHVASAVDLTNLEVLEVGSGRGGGASYVKRYLAPARMIGVDFSENAVRFCERAHQVGGLSFVRGDAESLPFDASCFDVVINVESSHCYGSMEKFLAEVRRVLRPGGHLLFADFREAGELERLHRQMERSGMAILGREDITQNVLASLDLDDARKRRLIRASFRDWLSRFFREFAGVKGSKLYTALQTGTTRFVYYVLSK